MKRNLSTTGLSLSQAQSISNLCHQRAQDIEALLSGVNNASKTFNYDGETLTYVAGKKLPENVASLLNEKAMLHACQAFLMEHIKLKDRLIREAQQEPFKHDIKSPERPEFKTFEQIPQINESWGWEQLSNSEMNEYLEAEAFAAHIGQFIHKDGTLNRLRTELPTIKAIEFFELEKDKKTPLKIQVHHKAEDLLAIHEELAKTHREHEQKVNYYKAKVKNLVTEESARIHRENAQKQADINAENQIILENHHKMLQEYTNKVKQLEHEFEQSRQQKIKEIAALRIVVDPRFQPTIDLFLPKVIVE